MWETWAAAQGGILLGVGWGDCDMCDWFSIVHLHVTSVICHHVTQLTMLGLETRY